MTDTYYGCLFTRLNKKTSMLNGGFFILLSLTIQGLLLFFPSDISLHI
jgi:hypothetical protein